MHKTTDHKDIREIRRTNTSIPAAYFEPGQENSHQITCQLRYGAAENVHQKDLCKEGTIPLKKPVVSVIDRKCNLEAYMLSFICEKNLSLSLTPKLVRLCKDLATDPKALDGLSFSHTSAIYIIVDGLSLTQKKKTGRCPEKESFFDKHR